MFYDQYILTKEKGCIGVVWLAATLGSKHSLKRLQKRDINSVNIDKACKFVAFSSQPLALRLSSNLMIGVTRVWAHQYGFFYHQVSSLHHRIRREVDNVKAAPKKTIDAKQNKATSAQLLLPEDPSFIPELAMANINQSFSLEDCSKLLNPDSPKDLPISNQTLLADSSFLEINDSSHQLLPQEQVQLDQSFMNGFLEEEPLDLDLDLQTEAPSKADRESTPQLTSPNTRSETELSLKSDLQLPEDDVHVNLMQINDEDLQPLPVPVQVEDEQVINKAKSIPARKRRRLPVMRPDDYTEIPQRTLMEWRNSYVERMKEASKKKWERQRRRLHDDEQDNHLFTFDWASIHPRLSGFLQRALGNAETQEAKTSPLGSPEQARKQMSDTISDIELGRDAPLHGSDLGMPWNLSSRSNSVVRSHSRNHTLTSSDLISTPLLDAHFPKHATSSPALSTKYDFALPSLQSVNDEDQELDGHLTTLLDEGLELNINTSDAADMSTFSSQNVEHETLNFYEFAKTAILESSGEIAFNDLIPLNSNRLVAVQAMSYTLSLITKNALQVKQEAPFASIKLSLPSENSIYI
ncbi:meiotic cohesin complex subunit Rec8 [Schizosaccharomyces japonicus yFS275]|uniref:Meiotic cohesin complex subunit Rec8 n=1 Tax=Schizosaccharomyces japonicus (strain yFS275 / FY16936) TaxID=402676 RepID=B6K5F1_SCHJY|nr:meiotic cohesin complex subunit Rec8 [Schizosaccharomyces japonicus yFS275]EEB08755.1 meiotic cohesin complex subunit Rec8 [Schizosaccharomyces japonicus yFS275]